MPALPSTLPPSVTGLNATYFGDSGGTTARYYWVRANYPSGQSSIAGSAKVTTPASLSKANQVLITWNSMPGAISYDVLQTTTATLPTVSAAIANALGTTKNSHTDQGDTLQIYVPFGAPQSGPLIQTAHAKYDFGVDGGVIGAILLASTVAIPANAIIVGATLNPTTALTSGGSATISVETTAGLTVGQIKAATAVASYSIDALLNGTVTLAAPVKTTAAGNIQITVAVAALTAGIMDIFVYYVLAGQA
ncbi:MAG: hypothetical protein ACHQ1H_07335 [Nitrososphaerales archaeon]